VIVFFFRFYNLAFDLLEIEFQCFFFIINGASSEMT
jgi:hypothetical protein